jgi:hypothetical protein
MRRVFGFGFLGILCCAFAHATPVFEFNPDITQEFTQSLPFLKWLDQDILPEVKALDFDGFDPDGPLTFAKFVDCFFKFPPDNDPPVGSWFGNDPFPFPSSDPGSDPPGDPVTPEPPAWTLLGIGLAGLALFRRAVSA